MPHRNKGTERERRRLRIGTSSLHLMWIPWLRRARDARKTDIINDAVFTAAIAHKAPESPAPTADAYVTGTVSNPGTAAIAPYHENSCIPCNIDCATIVTFNRDIFQAMTRTTALKPGVLTKDSAKGAAPMP